MRIRMYLQVLVLILFCSCKKDKLEVDFSDYMYSSYGSTRTELSIYHQFIVPENASNHDYVGKFYSLFTYSPVNQIVFELIGGNTEAFAINSLTGMIIVKDYSKLKPGKELLLIQTSDGNYTDIDTAEIKIIDKNKCVFVDPSYSGTENGTREKPYNSWKDVNGSYQPGYAYFQRRGTIGQNQINISGDERGTQANPIMIGAYGQGDRPEINGSGLGDKAGIYLGTWSLYTEWIEVYSFVVYNCRGFESTPGTRHFRIYNCEGYNNFNNGNFYFFYDKGDMTLPLDIELRNIIAHHGESHGIKFMTSGSRAYNCHTYENGGSGFKFSLESDNCYGEYILTHNNKSNGVTVDGDYAVISNSVSYSNSTSGFSFGGSGHHNLLRNVVACKNNYHGIYLKSFTHHINVLNAVSYENNYHGIRITGEFYSGIVEKCRLFANKENGLAINTDSDSETNGNSHDVIAKYNLIYDNWGEGVEVKGCSNITLHNNTIVKDNLYLAGTLNNIIIKNSLIQTVNNEAFLDTDNILNPESSIFVNYDEDDYRLNSTATIAIDKGTMMDGIVSDFEGNPIVGLPDIGAWEHVTSMIPVAPSDVSAIPVLNSRDIGVSWIDNSGNENGFIIERSTSGNDGFIIAGDVTGNYFLDEDLNEATTYYYRIYAYNENGNSNYSEIVSATTNSSGEPTTPEVIYVGNTSVFSDTSVTEYLRAQPAVAPETGTLVSISMYHQGGSGDMLLGIYNDNGGYPGNRLGITSQTDVNSSEGWQTIELITPVEVTAGQQIWLAWLYESIPGIRFDIGTPGRASASTLWGTGMPATFGDSSVDSYVYSIYATYDNQ